MSPGLLCTAAVAGCCVKTAVDQEFGSMAESGQGRMWHWSTASGLDDGHAFELIYYGFS